MKTHKNNKSKKKVVVNKNKKDNNNINNANGQIWEDIPVSLLGSQQQEQQDEQQHQQEEEQEQNEHQKNHYDTPSLARKAKKELTAMPGEDIGMMYGSTIQVLRGEDYQVSKDGQLTILFKNNSNTSSNTNTDTTELERKHPMEDEGKNNNNNNNNNDNNTTAATSLTTTTTTTTVSTKKKQKKKKKRKRKDDASTTTTNTSTTTSATLPQHTNDRDNKDDDDNDNDAATLQSSHDNTTTNNNNNNNDGDPAQEDQEDLHWRDVQQTWNVSCAGGMYIDDWIARRLSKLGYDKPTPIQAATLTTTTFGQRNVVGAAPTGSGKTLAFVLPMLISWLASKSSTTTTTPTTTDTDTLPPTAALVVAPTRELATQIAKTIQEFCTADTNQVVHDDDDEKMNNKHHDQDQQKGLVGMGIHVLTLVGGVALVKQERLVRNAFTAMTTTKIEGQLQDQSPPPFSIIVGTPGRLYAMMTTSKVSSLLQKSFLPWIQFLVLDEADRLLQDQFSFPQLIQILDMVHTANPGETGNDEDDDDDDMNDNEDEDGDGNDRLLGLPGIRGEAATQMLTPELLQQIQNQRQDTAPMTKEIDPQEWQRNYNHNNNTNIDDENEENPFSFENDDDDNDGRPKVHRQTLIYSATLTLPYTSLNQKRKPSRKLKHLPLEGGLADILEQTHCMGETKVVDLSTQHRLPPGLHLELIQCTQKHKDSHLYAYLMTYAPPGPALVFCNSIAGVKRVGITLQTLGFSVRVLHAHMQQKARFKTVEMLQKSDSGERVVVVCTDVAARGLDIDCVAAVVHYDCARAVDTFVHRAGRTARGMGADAVGSSLSLLAPSEDIAHRKIVEALGSSSSTTKFHKVALDGRLLTASQERVHLASRVVVAQEKAKKIHSSNQWFLDKAKEAELELDDDLLEDLEDDDDGHNSTMNIQERLEFQEAERAKRRLTQLLSKPMTTQRFGKFLSTNSAAFQKQIIHPASKPKKKMQIQKQLQTSRGSHKRQRL